MQVKVILNVISAVSCVWDCKCELIFLNVVLQNLYYRCLTSASSKQCKFKRLNCQSGLLNLKIDPDKFTNRTRKY